MVRMKCQRGEVGMTMREVVLLLSKADYTIHKKEPSSINRMTITDLIKYFCADKISRTRVWT